MLADAVRWVNRKVMSIRESALHRKKTSSTELNRWKQSTYSTSAGAVIMPVGVTEGQLTDESRESGNLVSCTFRQLSSHWRAQQRD